MKNKDLFNRMATFGFPLFEAGESQDANETLADMAKSNELRLWEGFPVVLANSAEKGLFNRAAMKRYLKKPRDTSCFAALIVMSLALYKSLGLKFPWAAELYNSLSNKEKGEFKGFLERLKKDTEFKMAGHVLSSKRLKSVFRNYFSSAQSKLVDLLSVRGDLALEYALSQVFSPKQKELFLKKLKREKLTKTEKEYFSRVVKKKVLALANTELHNLSRKLLE